MKKRKGIYIFIAVLLVLNIAAMGWYFYNEYGQNKTDKTAQEETKEEAAPQDAEAADGAEAGTAVKDPSDPLIAVVDYDTKDRKRIMNRVSRANIRCEAVGSLDELDVDKYDAIIIPGGNSVTPSVYGAEQDPTTKDTNLEKDEFQLSAVMRFADAGKPVLGICRGEQLVNNAFGGTTIQDMPEGWHKKDCDIRIAEGSWLYDQFGRNATTYHYHHQCVDVLGEGLYATEWDACGEHIEAYEHKTLPVYGIQWHPDSMAETGIEVFRSFGEIVSDNMKNGCNAEYKIREDASDYIKNLYDLNTGAAGSKDSGKDAKDAGETEESEEANQ